MPCTWPSTFGLKSFLHTFVVPPNVQWVFESGSSEHILGEPRVRLCMSFDVDADAVWRL